MFYYDWVIKKTQKEITLYALKKRERERTQKWVQHPILVTKGDILLFTLAASELV